MSGTLVDELIKEATGHGHRRDPVTAPRGGPAGNARLTSWTGLLLFGVIVAELITLLDVAGLMGWHVGLGIALVALTLVKSASTSWRILRYYTGSAPYVSAGPPPTPLRILGPVVIVMSLGVLGTGLALLPIGAEQSRVPLITVLGQPVSPLRLHQGFFILFLAAVGLHLLARFIPALTMTVLRRRRAAAVPVPVPVPGGALRAAVLVAALLASILAVVLVVPGVHWRSGHDRDHGHGPGTARSLGR